MNYGFVQSVQERYPPGTRIELLDLNYPVPGLLPHTMGTVKYVDEYAGIVCDFDNGHSCTILPGMDRFRRAYNKPRSFQWER